MYMNLVVIATIYNDRNKLIGVRLIDSDDNINRVKDVSVVDTINVLASKKCTIQNIGLSESRNSLTWTNGSIGRYPKIVNNKIKGKSSCIILYKTIGGFTISDFLGNVKTVKEEIVIKYAKEHGIANGKSIYKEGREYISSINGEYKYKDNYTGDRLNMTPLKPLAVVKYVGFKGIEYNIIDVKESKISNEVNKELDLTRIEEFSGEIFEYNDCTLAYKYVTQIDLGSVEKIKQFVYKYSSILNADVQAVAHYMYTTPSDSEAVLILGVGNYDYYVKNKRTDEEIIECIANAIKIGVKYRIYNVNIKDVGLKTVLKRNITDKGIDYEVLNVTAKKYIHLDTKVDTLERIFKNYEEYTNVRVNGSILTIKSLDGVYRYDMNKIHSIYKRGVVYGADKSKKALITGNQHIEKITQDGELHNIATSLKTIYVSDKVRKVLTDSIHVNSNNERIVFGANIEEVEKSIFCGIDIEGIENKDNIIEVEFKCKEYKTYIDTVVWTVSLFWTPVIKLNCRVNTVELANLMYKNTCNIEVLTFVDESDELWSYAVKYAVKNFIDLRVLNEHYNRVTAKDKEYLGMDSTDYNIINNISSFINITKKLVVPRIQEKENKEKLQKFVADIQTKLSAVEGHAILDSF